MPPRKRREPDEMEPRPRLKPATTPQGRENQLISLAYDLAEKQLMEGTASAQVISQFLKLGSSRDRLEQQRIAFENELIQKKIEVMQQTARIEDLLADAMEAFKSYGGGRMSESYDDYPNDPELF